jgi:hypothetical protein
MAKAIKKDGKLYFKKKAKTADTKPVEKKNESSEPMVSNTNKNYCPNCGCKL